MYGVKVTPFRSDFNSRLGVKRTLFRKKNDPKFEVKLGVKITPKKGVVLYLKLVLHCWSYNNSLKITV